MDRQRGGGVLASVAPQEQAEPEDVDPISAAADARGAAAAELRVGSAVWLKKDPSAHGTVIGKANRYWEVRLGSAGSERDETTKKFRHWDLQWSGQEQPVADHDIDGHQNTRAAQRQGGRTRELQMSASPPSQDPILQRRVRKQTEFFLVEREQRSPRRKQQRQQPDRKRSAGQADAPSWRPDGVSRQAASAAAEAAPLGDAALRTRWLAPEQIAKLLRECVSTGKAPAGFHLYPADATPLCNPCAGTVLFQQVAKGRTRKPDDHNWMHSYGKLSDSALSGPDTQVGGKQVLTGRQVAHHIDKSFHRRCIRLCDDNAVRLVQYIHVKGNEQPVGPSGARCASSFRSKRARPASSPSSSLMSVPAVAPQVTSQVQGGSKSARKRMRKDKLPSADALSPVAAEQLKEDPIAFTLHEVVSLAASSAAGTGGEVEPPGPCLTTDKRRWKVLIVGAGAAGLAAAQQLRSKATAAELARSESAEALTAAGLADEVLVLEGGQRLGGRIHTMHFPAVPPDENGMSLCGCRVDLGASYLHGYDFEDYLQMTGRDINPLQALVQEHGLKLKVDRTIPQQYSNGWRAHAAWFVHQGSNADRAAAPILQDAARAKGEATHRPVVARKGKEDRWSGPDRVFQIDAEIDERLAHRARELNGMKPFPLDSNVYDEWESLREAVLAQEKHLLRAKLV